MKEIIINQSMDLNSINNFTKASFKSSLTDRNCLILTFQYCLSATWSVTCFEFEWSSLNIYFTWPLFSIYCLNVSWERSRSWLGESVIVLLMAPGLLFTGHYFTTQSSNCANFRQPFSRFMFSTWSEIKSITRIGVYLFTQWMSGISVVV